MSDHHYYSGWGTLTPTGQPAPPEPLEPLEPPDPDEWGEEVMAIVGRELGWCLLLPVTLLRKGTAVVARYLADPRHAATVIEKAFAWVAYLVVGRALWEAYVGDALTNNAHVTALSVLVATGEIMVFFLMLFFTFCYEPERKR